MKFLHPSTVLVICAAPSIFAGPTDWPGWRGPEGTGVSGETGLPIEWSESAGVLWKLKLPEWGTSTPAIRGDAVFLTAQEGEKLLLLKASASRGQVEWTRQVGSGSAGRMPLRGKGPDERKAQKFHEAHNMASPSPATDGELVFAHFGNGDLAAYDFEGKERWRRNLQEEHGRYTIWWGHANSPFLWGDLVISACMQDSLKDLQPEPSPSYLIAHEKATGRERWKTMRMTRARAEECDSYTTPLLWKSEKGPQLLVMGGRQLDAYDPATGRQIWWLPDLGGNRTITGPTLGAGLVFATAGMRGPLFAVKPGGEGQLPAEAVVWKSDKATPDSPSPVVAGPLVFTVSNDGVLSCYEARTGSLHYRERLGGEHRASPVAAEGRVYFLDTKGRTTVVAASPRFEKLAENALPDETLASPAIAGGRIYLRGKRNLWCVGKAAPPADGWVRLFDGKGLERLRILDVDDFKDHGKVQVEGGALILGKGDPETGIVFAGDQPRDDYEVSLEAARLDGNDFFCGLTFTVGESACTLIVGGWGGMVIGLSNVDGMSAAENQTTSARTFENGRWYRIGLRVERERIQATIDGQKVIDLDREDHRFSVWPQQELVRPLGISAWHTKAGLREIRLRRLPIEAAR